MPVTPEASPDALDPHRVLRYNYGLLARRFGLRVCIFGFLMVLPIILGKLGVPSSMWATFPAFPGVIGLVFTVLNFKGHPLRLRKCKKVLSQYPLEQGTVTRPSKTTHASNKTYFTLDVTQRGAEGRVMVAVEPQGISRWPNGTEEGVWIAGDLPFGGVIVVPSSNALLLVRPENWYEAAPKRNGAAPDRIERAKNAGIELIPF